MLHSRNDPFTLDCSACSCRSMMKMNLCNGVEGGGGFGERTDEA